jgi:hypothetical protein
MGSISRVGKRLLASTSAVECSSEHISLDKISTGQLGSSLLMKEPNAISLRSSDDTTVPEDFKYSMRGKVISITYLGSSSIHKEIGRILRKIDTGIWGQFCPSGFCTGTPMELAARLSGTARTRRPQPDPIRRGSCRRQRFSCLIGVLGLRWLVRGDTQRPDMWFLAI